jgi:hypothetical protein
MAAEWPVVGVSGIADLHTLRRTGDDRPVGRRLEGIPGFGIDRVAEAAGSDPEVLRLENLDTDVPPHPDAVEVTRAAVGRDEANSYLPFSGLDEMKEAVAGLIRRRGGPAYDPYREVVITQDGDNFSTRCSPSPTLVMRWSSPTRPTPA